MITAEEKRNYRIWIWFFLAFILLYVVIEFMFNAMLLNVSSGFSVDDEKFHQVELFGRVLASVGCTISLFGVFSAKIRGLNAFTLKGAMLTFFLALVTIGPIFYFTTETLIEQGLVKQSNAEDRYIAVTMDYAKRLHASGFTRKFPYREEMMVDPHHPEAMTYLASFPLVGSMHEGLRNQNLNSGPFEAKGAKQGLIYYTSIHAMSAMDETYASYLQYEPQLRATYDDYLKASRKATYNSRGISDAEFNKIWIPARNELRDSWIKLGPSIKRERDSVVSHIRRNVSGSLYNYYTNARQQKYSLTLHRIESPAFLKKLKRSEIFGHKLVERPNGEVNRIEVSGNPNPFAIYCGGTGRIGRSCNPSREQLFDFIWDWRNYDLYYTKKTAGYPVTISTYEDFLTHKKTGRAMREKIESTSGIRLDRSFDTAFGGSSIMARRYIDDAIKKKSLYAWRQEFSKVAGTSVSALDTLVPNMSFSDFIQVKGIADNIREITGGFYSSKLELDMDVNTFYRKVMADVAQTQFNILHERYTREPQDYVNTRQGIEDGLSAYRMAIIPPIALMMSMFFSLVALLKLPLLINELIYCYSKGKHDYQSEAMWILIFGIAIVILSPFMLSPLSSLTDAMRLDIIALAEKSSVLALIQHWLYVVEPVLYGVGQGVLEMTGFDNLEIVHHAMYPDITK